MGDLFPSFPLLFTCPTTYWSTPLQGQYQACRAIAQQNVERGKKQPFPLLIIQPSPNESPQLPNIRRQTRRRHHLPRLNSLKHRIPLTDRRKIRILYSIERSARHRISDFMVFTDSCFGPTGEEGICGVAENDVVEDFSEGCYVEEACC